LAAVGRPDAILVDGVLPGVDGATVIRRLRLDVVLRRVPCLLMTASDDRGGELRALDAGADAFVRKGEDIELILARLGATLRSVGARAPDASASALGPKKILAVDDSQTFLAEIADSLRGEGYDVVPAHSGEEALELLAVQPVDCILLDLMMPGIGGQETCRRIKAAPALRDTPLILLTSANDRAARLLPRRPGHRTPASWPRPGARGRQLIYGGAQPPRVEGRPAGSGPPPGSRRRRPAPSGTSPSATSSTSPRPAPPARSPRPA